MNQETEIKFLITDKILFKKLQLFSNTPQKIARQTDRVFINKKNKKIIIRIRQERKKNKKVGYTLCIKKNTGGELQNMEWEVRITKPKDTAEIIAAMGWKKHLTIIKNRATFRMMGYSINYDKVRGLGNFIEIEKLSTNNKQRVNFKNIIRTLNLSNHKIIEKNYITLIEAKLKQSKKIKS